MAIKRTDFWNKKGENRHKYEMGGQRVHRSCCHVRCSTCFTEYRRWVCAAEMLLFIRLKVKEPVRLLDESHTGWNAHPGIQRTSSVSVTSQMKHRGVCFLCQIGHHDGEPGVHCLFLAEETFPLGPKFSAAPRSRLSAPDQIHKSHRTSALVWHETSRAGHVTHKI